MPIVKRFSKGSALTHAEMDNNFSELEDRITAQGVLQAATEDKVATLQTELDSNQATAQEILRGSVARLTAAKVSMQTSLTAWQTTSFSGATSTGDPNFDNLLNSIISELVTSVTAAIADIDANISELSVNFEI